MRKYLIRISTITGIAILFFTTYTAIVSFTFPQQDTTAKPFKVRTIVIDAGHGGKDPGAHGSYSVEKTVALDIALKLRDAIHENYPEIKVIMTRSDNTFIPLNHRSEIANDNNANLFISIHCNSSPEGTASIAHKQKGVMVLVYSYKRKGEQLEAVRENSSIYQEKNYKETYESYDETDPVNQIVLNTYMQKYRKQSILFGDLLMDQFKATGDRVALGVKEQSVLVLAHSGMPNVLIETGFINNPEEEDYLNSANGQAEIVGSIVKAIGEYKNEVDSK
ncbi:N-acetylmuramoyl-L-alanine amidase family protein [Mucilaginibacter sp. E4BP6]|uniref:N-acetylmuramoyl-L-alanine amidase family protein n=1 Tax=Mucilaginibacter sp. E4BP6 TaxID=2723089 RepID=UPI0015CB238E|nr:N-acetylmuramoyl-L-alanine amidase [Mucilaginibacter sp. E4BP6]NYE67134.1 N-acetylmuramoyl-L-alanine amidase [Mucilaginibacter sp. E4BP6]